MALIDSRYSSYIRNSFRLFLFASYVTLCNASTTVLQTSTQATITYTGADGTIEYDWLIPPAGSVNSLGILHVKPRLGNLAPTDIPLTPMAMPASVTTSVPANTPITFQSAQWSANAIGPLWILTYRAGTIQQNIYLQFTLAGRFLNVQITASQPILNGLNIGPWPASSNPRNIPVPYYPGNSPFYLQASNLFATAYYDWRSSNASWMDDSGQQSIYLPLTNKQLNAVQERIVVGVSANLVDLFPDMKNPASPYMSELAGRMVLDIWAYGFSSVATTLSKLSSHGLKDCVILLHNWQYYGYDNGLPAHVPANPSLGGDAALSNLVQIGQSLGCRFALHENYTDYYQDFPSFSFDSVALDSNGNSQLAWFNPTARVQANVTKPTQFLKYASQQSPIIKQTYKTDSAFIDVNSAPAPWFRADMDAKAAGAGQFASYMNASIELWRFARALYRGPVFGEGRNHAFWSGLLDGTEAQFGAGGVPTNLGGQAPLLVDFDLAKMHPFQINHGMGYYERWIGPGDDIQNTNSLDAYRMQELIYGHAPFLGGTLWSNPARMMVEQNLVGPVARRYGTQEATSVQYQFKGNWTDLNTASKGSTWNRVQVRYANGDVIVANGMAQPLIWQGYTLPANGWMATGNGLLAYTAQKNGVVVDYAETSDSIFANARNQSDLQLSGAMAQVTAGNFSQPVQGVFSFSLNWLVLDYADIETYDSFIQFVSPTSQNPEGIAFQCGHPPPYRNSAWQPGVVLTDNISCYLPGSVPDGNYQVSVGIYLPSTGERQILAGTNDGSNRFVVGTLTIAKGGSLTTFKPQAAASESPNPRLNSTGALIDFTTVRTDGMVSMVHDATGWTLRSYPTGRNVTIQIASSRIPQPPVSDLKCDSPTTAPSVVNLGNGYWQLQTKGAKSCHW